MKTNRLYFLVIFLLLVAIGVSAQESNRLYIPDINVEAGKQFQLPIYVQNTSQKITGVQFTISVPKGVTPDFDGIKLTERSGNHKVKWHKDNDSQWTLMLYSSRNVTIKANAGVILNIPAIVADSVKEGSTKELGLEKVALSDSIGKNVLTEFSCGKINIAKTPDFIITDIKSDLTTINPEDNVNIEWKVKNIGSVSSTGGWSEVISLVSEDGDAKVLATTHYNDGVLASGAEISRKMSIRLERALGVSGKGHFKIELKPNADSGERDANIGNNISESVQSGLTINQRLYVTMADRMDEPSSDKSLIMTVLRSGSWKSNEVLTITKQGDDRVQLPENTIIPASNSECSFTLKVKGDEILNEDSLFTIIVAADGYESVRKELIIVDDDIPHLKITSSSKELQEGGKMTVTITNERAPKSPLTINIKSDLASRLKYPATVIMEAGQKTVTFELEAIQDAEVTDTLAAAINISADKHHGDELLILFVDDDMPELELTLKPTTVGEGDGPTSIIGKIIRKTKVENKVTIVLSDDSDGQLYYGLQNNKLVLNAGVTEAEFSMGAIDNAEVDGTRQYNVTAAVYISSCSCSAKSSSVGSVSQQITVTDDDGPTLKVVSANSSIKEGGQSTLTITLNTNTDADVSVNLSSDYDDMLEYNHQVIIPAGKKSVEVAITAKKNELAEDNRVVVFTVEADGYAPGTCWVQITDQTIPDAMITNITVTPSELEVGQKVTVNVTIKNKGNADLPSLTRVNFYFRNNTKELGHAYTADALAIDGELTLNNELEMPDIPGNYTLYAVINEDRAINELTYSNNNSQDVAIRLLPAFTATVQTDKNLYSTSETVTFSGKATGTKAANSDVEVYFINEGNRQTITAKTDNEGNYSIEYPLPKTMSGHFIVGACYPNEKLQTEMATFDVYGLRLSACSNNCEFDLGDIYEGSMTITNAVNIKQTGLKIVQNGSSENSVFAFTLPETIEAGKNIKINFTITPSAVSTGRDLQKMPITITSNEGASTDYCIYYYVKSRLALLSSNVKSINTTMTKGKKRDYPITIKNLGKGETGKITLGNLPNWMKTSTPLETTSLLQGDSVTIVLQLIPTDDLALNIPIEGSISIICENGSSLRIPCSITPVSESEGKLIVDVVDEFTFETNEAPHVSNAKIVVMHPTTREVIAQGNSGEDGKFSIMLPEGQYEVTVTAENHEDYTNQIIVDAGVDNNHEAFVSYDAVTYSWDVVETEIEDSYEIETIVKFDVRVPKPVILITLPEERPEDGAIIPIVVTNKGFINAEDVNVSLAISGNYNIEFLTEPYLAKLAANQSEVFYARIKSLNATRAGTRAPSLRECLSLQAKLRAHYICGNKYDNTVTADDLRRWGECLNYAGSVYSYGGWGGYGGGGGGYGGWGGYGSGGWWQIVPIPVKACSPGNDNNNPDGNNPGLPNLVPENEPEEQDCNEEPILNYKLVPVEGKRYDILGVAADGVSQLKIVFDKGCKIPSEDCKWTCSWSLENDNGKIGELTGDTNSWDGVIYTAPEDFPSDAGYEYPIKAKITYTNGKESFEKYVDIIIARVPLVLLHGLNADSGTWNSFEESLIKQGLYNAYQIDNTGYKETNCSYFTVNSTKPQEKINNLFRAYLEDGLLASKADLVGHSMGGILSRLHVQYIMNSSKPNVHKVITVNTPHSGSEIGDLFQNLDAIGLPGVFSLGQIPTLFNMFSSTDAIYDLAVNSDAIDKYLNNETALGKMAGIPVHAIVTEASYLKDYGDIEIKDWKSFVDYMSRQPLGVSMSVFDKSKEGWLGLLQLAKGLSYDDLNEIGASDYIVSVQSQKGGLPESNISYVKGPWHCGSPDNKNVQEYVLNALNAETKSSIFCTTGFNPVDRKFIFNGGNHILMSRSNSLSSKEYIDRIDARIQEDSLYVNYSPSDNAKSSMIFVSFGNSSFCAIDNTELTCEIPSTFNGKIQIYGIKRGNGNELYVDSIDLDVPKSRSIPLSITYPSKIYIPLDSCSIITLYCTWSDGTRNIVIPENAVCSNNIIKYDNGNIIASKIGSDNIVFSYKGLTLTCPIIVYDAKESDNSDNNKESDNSVCSTITLSFKQEMVMTRQAFRGTLTVNNGDAVNEMKDVKLNLEVKDKSGNVATSHEFQINVDSLKGFVGERDLAAGWKLEAKGTGVATILFIPTKYAAPTEAKEWSFGGTFSYTDPATGLAVTKELHPVTLTVKPSPNLVMDYFMQRDVFGDDALTEDIVEPIVPAEFSLLINNIGYGDATNVKMVTNQPEIIDNEKGLLIDFEILSSQLNGGERTLALGQSVATDFGTIPAGNTSYAQWWFTSSLLGHFTEYDVKATHLTSYGNPDLSLLDTVIVHELIHTLTIPASSNMRGFLVNDVKDTNDMPDKLYLTDGTTRTVANASATITEDGNNHYTLTVSPSAEGWNYGSLTDPTAGRKTLASITRQSDGASIDLSSFWQTDRTLRDGKDPLYEFRLHFADEMSASGEAYTLKFEDKPITVLDVESFEGVSETDIINTPVEKITVLFNKEIAASSFTTEDLELRRAGSKLDVDKIVISQVNEKQFDLDLKELTSENGYYVLTVQAAGIRDKEGYTGEFGRQLTWTQLKDGVLEVQLDYEAQPGWNWISSSLAEADKKEAKTFLEPIKDQVIRLVGFENELINDPVYGFVGKLTTISPENGYKLHVKGSTQFSYSGLASEPAAYSIDLKEGWNWIGYLPVNPLSVQDAMKNHSPMENDVLKGQDAFVTYTDGVWTGTLTEMKPGEGYMYYSSKDTSFKYPKVYALSMASRNVTTRAFMDEANPWLYDAHKYADNATLIGKLYVDDKHDVEGIHIVGAFAGDECRGVGKNINGLVYMVIHGDIGDSQMITFRTYNTITGIERAIQESIGFGGQSVGNVNNPQIFHVKSATGISSTEGGFYISPRPLKNTLYISGNTSNIKSVQILSTSGKTMQKSVGYDQSGIDVGMLLPSMYIVTITTNDGKVYYEKVFKK